jgi:hypothetical protein
MHRSRPICLLAIYDVVFLAIIGLSRVVTIVQCPVLPKFFAFPPGPMSFTRWDQTVTSQPEPVAQDHVGSRS